ncbi:MAG: diguanylate cyclase and metal dependent phosphohydrolase [Firmicutes bacterium]|nr:diguanylate cyclase and metal dependent phosphohydrolase [Bacillota bacterium]
MAKVNKDEHLFEDERETLQSAIADIENIKYQDNPLLDRYEWLVGRYNKLLSLTRKIFRISDSQGHVLHRHQNEIQNLLDNANQGFLTFGLDLKVNRQYSAECLRIFERKIGGISILELMSQWDEVDIEYWKAIFTNVFSSAQDGPQSLLKQLPPVIKIGDMDIRVECKLISQAYDDNEQKLIMMILTDITEKRKSEEHIHYLSYHDKLTSLYNRAYIEMMLPELEKSEAFPLSVIVIDMNGLKLVNDVFGHTQGDQFLVAMAQVMMAICRQTDVIARWGGDEFIILLPRTNCTICGKICDRIRIACSKASSTPIRLSAAIGTATKMNSATNFEELFSIAEKQMYSNKLANRQIFRQNVISEMENRLYSQCFESIDHGERVLRMAISFADFSGINLDNVELQLLNRLATFHDIGKVAIPREILGKSESLNTSEWKIVQSHSDIGYRMAQSIGDLPLAEMIVVLHERWDGSGYPHGLVGHQIPLLARLFSLVDVYDVLTHDRPYRKAMDKRVALQEISFAGSSQFDPELTRKFLEYMADEED